MTARVWDARTGAEVLTLKGHTDTVLSAARPAPTAGDILTASADGTARVWDPTGAELRHAQRTHQSRQVGKVQPRRLANLTGSDDRTARVWDARSGPRSSR